MIKFPKLVGSDNLNKAMSALNGPISRYTLRILLVAHILATSYWPSEYINIFQHLATRIVLAVVIVALLFWDIASGILLAILLVVSIQESKSRQTGASVLITGSATSLGDQVKKMASGQEIGLVHQSVPSLSKVPKHWDAIPSSSVYGQQQVPQITAGNEKVGAYMDQIGELGISKQIQAGQGVQIVDGVPSVKVNMGQTGPSLMPMPTTSEIPTMPFISLGKEGYQMPQTETTAPTVPLGTGSAPTVPLGTEYDHPANKTMSENLKAQATGFITDKNLLDAQINSITGLDGSQPPCFVASQSGIWNAQGFGSIARAVDNEDCPHSFV